LQLTISIQIDLLKLMAYTQSQLDKITEAIALGATTVEYGDKKITYRSLTEMKRIKQDMESELGSNSKIIRRKTCEYDRGF